LVSAVAEVEAEAEDAALVTLDAFGNDSTGWVARDFAALAAGALATLEPMTSFGPPAGCFAAELVVEGLGFAALDAGLT
jgi:hypothetical protein